MWRIFRLNFTLGAKGLNSAKSTRKKHYGEQHPPRRSIGTTRDEGPKASLVKRRRRNFNQSEGRTVTRRGRRCVGRDFNEKKEFPLMSFSFLCCWVLILMLLPLWVKECQILWTDSNQTSVADNNQQNNRNLPISSSLPFWRIHCRL